MPLTTDERVEALERELAVAKKSLSTMVQVAWTGLVVGLAAGILVLVLGSSWQTSLESRTQLDDKYLEAFKSLSDRVALLETVMKRDHGIR